MSRPFCSYLFNPIIRFELISNTIYRKITFEHKRVKERKREREGVTEREAGLYVQSICLNKRNERKPENTIYFTFLSMFDERNNLIYFLIMTMLLRWFKPSRKIKKTYSNKSVCLVYFCLGIVRISIVHFNIKFIGEIKDWKKNTRMARRTHTIKLNHRRNEESKQESTFLFFSISNNSIQ